MYILPYKLTTTKDRLTSKTGIICIADLMQSLSFREYIDKVLPVPGSNRGFSPSLFIETMILLQHQGYFHLEDVRQLELESDLLSILGLKRIPSARALGQCVKRTLKSNFKSTLKSNSSNKV